jgi:hypothetical protein
VAADKTNHYSGASKILVLVRGFLPAVGSGSSGRCNAGLFLKIVGKGELFGYILAFRIGNFRTSVNSTIQP